MADIVRVDDDGGVYVGPDADTMDIVFRHNDGDHSRCTAAECAQRADLERRADEVGMSRELLNEPPVLRRGGVRFPVSPQIQDAWHELNSHQRAIEQPLATGGIVSRLPRVGDQPLPVPNGLRSVQCMVREDLVNREQVGRERYGTSLQPFNGRDSLRDAYEEVLDLACYLRQMIAEREAQPPPSHTVWVVVSDCGLNGPLVHAVLNADPGLTPRQLETKYVLDEGTKTRGSLPGGYQGTEVIEMEVSGA